MIAVVVSAAYLIYRGFLTLNLTTGYATFASWLLFGAECFTVLLFWLYLLQVWHPVSPSRRPVLHGRSVDVFIPTLNEDVNLLRRTVLAATRMRYPHTVYVLDDGNRSEVRELAERLGAEYLSRPDRAGAKAGSLNHALERSDGEFVVVLDADDVPDPDLIVAMIGHFRDPKVGFVQSPHAYSNFDSFQSFVGEGRPAWDESALFHRVIQPGRNRWNATICAGSGVMIRRDALAQVGGFATETITEDMHTGLRMHARGWKSVAAGERLMAGLAPQDLKTFQIQRTRWGEGNLCVPSYDNPLTLPGLTLGQRLCYLATVLHWLGGFARLAIYLTPILMLFTGVPPVNGFTWHLLAVTLTYLAVTFVAVKLTGRGRASVLHAELFGMAGFWTQIRAAFRAATARTHSFVVTRKRGRDGGRVWAMLLPQALLGAAGVAALAWGWARPAFGISDDPFKPIVPSVWIAVELVLIAWVIRRAYRRPDRREAQRQRVHLPVEYAPTDAPEPDARLGMSVDLSEAGVGLVAYEMLPSGTRLRLTIHGPAETIECLAEVRGWLGLAEGGRGGFRYGVVLLSPSRRQTDAIHRLCAHHAVALRHAEIDRRLDMPPLSGLVRWPFAADHRKARRHPFRLPVRLRAVDPEGDPGDVYATTEELSRDAFVTQLPDALPVGSRVPFRLPSPAGELRGVAEVVRVGPSPAADGAMKRHVLRFHTTEGQGKTVLQSLTDRRTMSAYRSILTPRSGENRPVGSAPMLVTAAAWVALAAAVLIPFRAIHADDFFLRDVVDSSSGSLSTAEMERIDAIADRTLAEARPNTDRLALLLAALGRRNADDRRDAVTLRLAERDPANLPLRVAHAHALDRAGDHARAEAEFDRLLEPGIADRLPPGRVEEVRLAAARAAGRAGRYARAVEHYRSLLYPLGGDVAVRDELAGLLLRVGRESEVPSLYTDAEPGPEGLRLLTIALVRIGVFDRAAEEARRLAWRRPDDADAARLVADVDMARKNFTRAAAVYRRLLEQDPDAVDLRSRLARAANGSGRHAEALGLFRDMILAGDRSNSAIDGFIDAAAAVDSSRLTGADRGAAVVVADPRYLTATDGERLARFAAVMARFADADRAEAFAREAVVRSPNDPELRVRAAEICVGVGRTDAALELLGEAGDERDRARILAGAGEFAAAEAASRRVLEEHPSDTEFRVLLSDLLVGRGDFERAEAELQRPEWGNEPPPEVRSRLAELALRRGDHGVALGRYQRCLEDHFGRPELWAGFIDASAGVAGLTQEQIEIARRIANRAADGLGDLDTGRLARLAGVLVRADEVAAAEPLFDRALALGSDDAEARADLAEALNAAGRHGDAARLLERQPAPDADSRLRLARVLSAANEFDRAASQARLALESDPENREGRFLLAEATARSGEADVARAMWESLARDHPDDPEPELRAAELLLESAGSDPTRLRDALNRFDALLSRGEVRPRVSRGWARAAARIGDSSLSLRTAAVRLASGQSGEPDPEVIAPLSRVLYRVRETARADALLDSVLVRPVAHAATRRELAETLSDAGRAAEALRLYLEVPPGADDDLFLAGLAMKADEPRLAVRHARRAVAAAPTDPAAARTLAVAFVRLGEHTNALAVFGSLPAEMTDDRPLSLVFGLADTHADGPTAFRRSREAFLEAVARDGAWLHFIEAAAGTSALSPESVSLLRQIDARSARTEWLPTEHLTRLATALRRAGDIARSNELLDRATGSPPRRPDRRHELATALLAAGRTEDAAAVVRARGPFALPGVTERNVADLIHGLEGFQRKHQQAVSESPTDAARLERLADALAWGGRFAEAAAVYERIGHAGDDSLHLRRAWSLLWSGDPAGAVEVLASAPSDSLEAAELLAEATIRLGTARSGPLVRAALARSDGRKWNDPEALARTGFALALIGDGSGSEAAFRQAFELRPDSRALYAQRAEAYASLRMYAEAEEDYRIALGAEHPHTSARP